jgi:hypothetical protein
MSFTNFTTGRSHSFDDPSLPGEMQTTITVRSVSCGTLAKLVEAEIPDQLRRQLPTAASGGLDHSRSETILPGTHGST